MYVEKVTRIEMSKEEIGILKQAENILQEICDTFVDCEECPLYNICLSKSAPSNLLYRCIKALSKESEEENK